MPAAAQAWTGFTAITRLLLEPEAPGGRLTLGNGAPTVSCSAASSGRQVWRLSAPIFPGYNSTMSSSDTDREFPGNLLAAILDEEEGEGGASQGGAAVFLSFHGLSWIGPFATEEEAVALVAALGLTRNRRSPRPELGVAFAKPRSIFPPPRLLKRRVVARVRDRLPLGWTLWLVCNQDGLKECFILHSPDGWVVGTFSSEDAAVRFARTRAAVVEGQDLTVPDAAYHPGKEPKS